MFPIVTVLSGEKALVTVTHDLFMKRTNAGVMKLQYTEQDVTKQFRSLFRVIGSLECFLLERMGLCFVLSLMAIYSALKFSGYCDLLVFFPRVQFCQCAIASNLRQMQHNCYFKPQATASSVLLEPG